MAREAFAKQKAEVVGASRDSIKSHENFIAKQDLNLLLLSDKDGELCSCLDVLKEKTLYGKKVIGLERSTFVFDEEGKLLREWRKVKVEGHVAEVYNYVAGLEQA